MEYVLPRITGCALNRSIHFLLHMKQSSGDDLHRRRGENPCLDDQAAPVVDGRLGALQETMRRQLSAESVDEVYALTVEVTHELVGQPLGAVQVVEVDGDELARRASTADSEDSIPLPSSTSVLDAVRSGSDADEPIVRTNGASGSDPGSTHVTIPGHAILTVATNETFDLDSRSGAHLRMLAANTSAVLGRFARERELERENRRLASFASVVSHDVKNPLQVAQGWLSITREERDSPELDRVATALDRIQVMLGDLEEFSRFTTDEVELSAVDLAEVIDRVWVSVQPVSAADAEMVCAGDQPTMLEADPRRLVPLLENLFRNALTHVGSDVTITWGMLPDGFFVEDDGPGIPEEVREDAFEWGFSTEEDGTGFGLAIVWQIAHIHGWEVDITDAADGGARVEITGAKAHTA